MAGAATSKKATPGYLTDYPFLADTSLPETLKTLLLQDALTTRSLSRGEAFERLKFWQSTPLVVALVGVITIVANAGVSYLLSNQTAGVTASQEQRQFSYELIRTELSKTNDQVERANVLLFLAKAGVLSGLNIEALEAFAKADGATGGIPPTIGQTDVPAYNEPAPLPIPEQTDTGNEALRLAVLELNKNIHEQHSFGEVLKYWDGLGLGDPSPDLAWSTAFVSWIIAKAGNPDQLSLSASTSTLWVAGVAAHIAIPASEGFPLPGDIVVLGRNEGDAKAIAGLRSAPGAIGIVYKVDGDLIRYIGGNIRNALRIVDYAPNDRLVGYLRLGKASQ